MTSIQSLVTRAIAASQNGTWEDGKLANEEILAQEPENIPALNRLAFCEMQLGHNAVAKKHYEQVLELERCNSIALKYLAILKQKVNFVPSTLNHREDFIEEPGKTKSITLQKLADPDVLQSTAIATPCLLVVKNHRVNVQTVDGNTYLGCLPDDIAFRLQRLIKLGNTYSVFVQSTSKKTCVVFIKELLRSKDALTPSFPSNSSGTAPALQEDALLDETPLDTRETGNDELESDSPGTTEEDDNFTERE